MRNAIEGIAKIIKLIPALVVCKKLGERIDQRQPLRILTISLGKFPHSLRSEYFVMNGSFRKRYKTPSGAIFLQGAIFRYCQEHCTPEHFFAGFARGEWFWNIFRSFKLGCYFFGKLVSPFKTLRRKFVSAEILIPGEMKI
jgi:hypothetical protein